MATVYIQPGTGTGLGTEASPYYFSELATAESTAGTSGTILFTDGDYSITGTTTFAGASGLTYESLNPHGANLKTSVSTTFRKMIIGGQTTPVTFKNFKTEQCYFQFDNAGNSTNASTITGCYITYPVAVTWTGSTVSLVRASSTVQSNIHQFTFNVAKIPFTGTGDHRIMQGANMEIIGCTFDLITSGGGLNPTDLNLAYGPPTTLNRNIWVCDDDSIFAATGNPNFDADIANYSTNSSFYQMGSINDSGGTNNLYDTDPQFIDQTNGDYRLRPTSPCISGASDPPSGTWIFNGTQSGTADGSYSDPYDLSNLSTAESDAVAGNRKIFFKDGTYNLSSALTFGSAITSTSLTYGAESTRGVTFSSTSTYDFGNTNLTAGQTYEGLIFNTSNTGSDLITWDQDGTF